MPKEVLYTYKPPQPNRTSTTSLLDMHTQHNVVHLQHAAHQAQPKDGGSSFHLYVQRSHRRRRWCTDAGGPRDHDICEYYQHGNTNSPDSLCLQYGIVEKDKNKKIDWLHSTDLLLVLVSCTQTEPGKDIDERWFRNLARNIPRNWKYTMWNQARTRSTIGMYPSPKTPESYTAARLKVPFQMLFKGW